MALHLAANGCYGVMIYNNKDYPDSYINEELKKYGKVHEAQKGGKNLIFIYYKQYEEARACLDALSSDPDFNAKPAKPRETSRAVVSYGARERAKSVGERVRHKFEPCNETKRTGDKTERDASKEEEHHPLRKRSMSITSISVDKVENSTIADKSDIIESPEIEKDNTEEPKIPDQTITLEFKQKIPFRPRSKSVGRLNVEDEAKRAELIKKVIKCENNPGGSLDSLFEKEIVNKADEDKDNYSTPCSQLQRSKSFHENLASGGYNNSWQNDSRRKSNLWLTPKPSFYKSRNGNRVMKREFNEPYLLPAMTIYEHYVIARQPKKFSQIVVVTGLPLYITEEYLCDLCAKFARVLRIRLVDTRNIQEGRAYVYVKSKRDAINLKRNIDRKILFCHIVEVTILSDISNVLPFIKY